MPTRDKFHQECRVALEKDGWTITHDFVLSFLIHKHKALYNGKIENYQNIITQILEEYAEYLNEPNIETQVICDYKRNHFQLIKIGWENDRRYHYCVFHFDIKNEKIWLQENNSDIRIALDLEQKGVPKSEIVLGIHAPSLRSYSDYAAA